MLKLIKILEYPDFTIYLEHPTGKYICLLPEDGLEEVELCAELTYDVDHDVVASDEDLMGLFDCDYCGEQVLDDCIKYFWFKRK